MTPTLQPLGREAALGDMQQRAIRQAWFLAAGLATVALVTLVCALVAILEPGIRPLLLQEDGIIEAASATVLSLVVVGSACAIYRWGFRIPFVSTGLLGLAELMDEISFGSRIFRFEPPALYGGGELDGFHDLLILVLRLLGDANQGLAWLWMGSILATAVGLIVYAAYQIAKSSGGAKGWISSHTLIFIHFGLMGLAQVIDIASHSSALSAMEEVLELDAEILLGFYLAQQAYTASVGPRCYMTADS